jgi:geranylgeranyl diphosphate synthase type II
MTTFASFVKEQKTLIDKQVAAYTSSLEAPAVLKDAMLYSLEAGGKRIRPLLLFATLHAFQKDYSIGVPAACALEMIHTYSLIHDDLPSMDNDDLRRGKPTNHKVFGEATAILAGDGLLTYAFQVIASNHHPAVTPAMNLRLVMELAKAAGPEGMVAGQVADMEAEEKTLTVEQLEYVHRNKTGRLLEFSVLAGAILARASQEQIEKLLVFARNLGLAFQIRDDILDVEGTEEEIGKPIGSDAENKKSTYTTLFTLEEAKNILRKTIATAKDAVVSLGLADEYLLEICELVANRNN